MTVNNDAPELQPNSDQLDSPVITESHSLVIDDSEEVAEVKQENVETPTVPEEPEKAQEAKDIPIEDNKQRKKQNAVQDFNIDADEKLNTGDELVLPSNFDKETRSVLEAMPNIDLLDSPESRNWANTVAEGLEYTTSAEMFVPTLENESAEFRQKLSHEGISLNAQPPKFKPAENQNLKGERAVIRLISHLGLGTLFQAPMWHSGMWLTFKPPTESEIIELNRILISDKVKFGRYTYGLAFSNTTAYTIDRLVDFAIAHVYDITAKAEDITVENLKQHISCQDIPSLLWGFICTMYPRGFRYRRACINDPEKCNYVLEETLNVSKLQWTNLNALNDWQRTFMTGRQPKNKDLTSINRYKEELNAIQKQRIEINKDKPYAIALTIKTPSITDYIDAGHRWIGDIVNTVEKSLAADATEAERNNTITRYGQASAMRQYSHWIESIEYETNIIDDRETIEKVLDTLSADDDVRNTFIKHVVDFINKSTISVIGIPVFDCPNCGTTQEGHLSLPQYKNIIPLDLIQVFFALLLGRLSRLTER